MYSRLIPVFLKKQLLQIPFGVAKSQLNFFQILTEIFKFEINSPGVQDMCHYKEQSEKIIRGTFSNIKQVSLSICLNNYNFLMNVFLKP